MSGWIQAAMQQNTISFSHRDIMERKKRIMVNNLAKSPRPITEPTMVELKPLKITAETVDKTTPNVPGRPPI